MRERAGQAFLAVRRAVVAVLAGAAFFAAAVVRVAGAAFLAAGGRGAGGRRRLLRRRRRGGRLLGRARGGGRQDGPGRGGALLGRGLERAQRLGVGDDLLERGARTEARHRGLLDLHGLARARVAARAGVARLLLEGAEAADGDLVTLGDGERDELDDRLDGGHGLLATAELGLEGVDHLCLVHGAPPGYRALSEPIISSRNGSRRAEQEPDGGNGTTDDHRSPPPVWRRVVAPQHTSPPPAGVALRRRGFPAAIARARPDSGGCAMRCGTTGQDAERPRSRCAAAGSGAGRARVRPTAPAGSSSA